MDNNFPIFYISMQTVENYNIDADNFNQTYWKFKFGSELIITGIDKKATAVAFAMKYFGGNSQNYFTYVSEATQVNWDYMGELEETYLEYGDTPSIMRIYAPDYVEADDAEKYKLRHYKSKEEFFRLSKEAK